MPVVFRLYGVDHSKDDGLSLAGSFSAITSASKEMCRLRAAWRNMNINYIVKDAHRSFVVYDTEESLSNLVRTYFIVEEGG